MEEKSPERGVVTGARGAGDAVEPTMATSARFSSMEADRWDLLGICTG